MRRQVLALLALSLMLLVPAYLSTRNLEAPVDPSPRTMASCEVRGAMPSVLDEILILRYWGQSSSQDGPGLCPQAQDFYAAMWIFLRPSGDAALLIEFRSTAEGTLARIYDDTDGDAAVDYRIEDGRVTVTEGFGPRISINMLPGGVWHDAERVTWDMDIMIDGAMNLSGLDGVQELAIRDGTFDYEIQVRPETDTGALHSSVRRWLGGDNPSHALQRSILALNKDSAWNLQPTDFVLWPLLGEGSAKHRSSADHHPPIQVDWEAAKVVTISELLPETGPRKGLKVISLDRLYSNHQIHDLNFENPFAFYKFLPTETLRPDVIARFERYPPHDQYFRNGRFEHPMQTVRYSWDSNGDGGLDCKVSVVGRNAYNAVVSIAQFEIMSIPYEEIPGWIRNNPWDGQILVCIHDGHYVSAEGIYEWGVPIPLRDGYFTGETSVADLRSLGTLPQGFRGEYRIGLERAPVSPYRSPIDGLIHLKGATFGVWHIGENDSLRYYDSDGDGTFDRWIREQDATRSSLTVLGNLVVLVTDNRIQVKETKLSTAAAAPPLPTSAKTLTRWGEIHRDSDPLNPEHWFDSLSDPARLTIQGFEVGSARAKDGMFRIQLLPSEGFSTQPPLGLADRVQSPFEVLITPDGWKASALGIPSPAIDGPDSLELTIGSPRTFSVRVDVPAGADMASLTLASSASHRSIEASVEGPVPPLSSRESHYFSIKVWGSQAGTFEYTLRLGDMTDIFGRPIPPIEGTVTLFVEKPGALNAGQALHLLAHISSPVAILSLLVSLSLLIAVFVRTLGVERGAK